MAQNFNSQRPPAPLQTPLLTGASMENLSLGQDRGMPTPVLSAFFTSLADVITQGPTLQGTHAQRINTNPLIVPFYSPGRFLSYLFWETDRKTLYISSLVAGVPTWVLVSSGILVDVLANIPTGLGTADVGFLFGSSDYGHLHRWTGAAWTFAPGDSGSEYIVAGTPNSPLWAPCDGASYGFAQPDGSIVNKNTPLLTGDVFIMGANAIGTQQADTRAEWEAGAITDDESTHTHPENLPASNSYGAGGFGAYPGGLTATGPGDAHHHALSNTNAQLKKFSTSGKGLPLRIQMTFFARR